MATDTDVDGNVVVLGKAEESYEGYDQGGCPVCYNSGERTKEDVIDDDDEIWYECMQCEVGWKEVRQSVGYKGLHGLVDWRDTA